MYSDKLDFLLKLVTYERVCEEAHTNPNEHVSQNLVEYPVMSGKLVYGRNLRMYIALKLTFY